MSVTPRSLECPVYSQLLQKKNSKSPAWVFFGLPANESSQILSNDLAICKLCKVPVSAKGGSTSNLFNHLKLYHPMKFCEINKKKRIPFVQNAAVCIDIDEPQAHSSKTMTAAESDHLDNQNYKRQKLMTDFQLLNDQSSKRCTNSVTKFLVCTMQPYNIVQRDEFIDMIKTLNPRYKLPGRKHFSATAVPKLYHEVKEKVGLELSSMKNAVSITTDCWTSISNIPFITLTAHFVTSEWELKSVCLACAHFDDDHTGKNLAEVMKNILCEWNIDIKNVVSVTTDNGANVLKCVEELKLMEKHISCFAHNINIGINHALGLPLLKKAIAHLKKLQNSVAMSWKMKRDLHKAQELLQMDNRTLPSACPTRWWSTLKLCKRFLENQLPIRKMIQEYPSKKYLLPESFEISALEDFVKATELLEDITTTLNGEKYVTASSVLPLYFKIKNNLKKKDQDSSLLISLKAEILRYLTKYESEPLVSQLRLSTFCDPRFRLNFIEHPEETKRLAVQKMKVLVEEKTTNSSIPETQQEFNKKGLAKFFNFFDSNENSENSLSSSQQAEKEINDYLSMPKVSFDHDPLDWWRVHKESFPLLKILAQTCLSIQGSSVPSERVFSTGGSVITKQRASLLPKHAEMQIFLARNKQYI